MANIPIGNNIIYMQKKGSTDPKDTVETVLFGAERIDVGINAGHTEIAKDKVSGYNYERDAVDSKTVYNLQKQKRKCFFVLDLETGKRGWYPGAIQVTDIKGTDVEVKTEKSDTSQTVTVLQEGTQVKVMDLEYDDNKTIWYKIDYNNLIGYVKSTNVYDIRYVDPY